MNLLITSVEHTPAPHLDVAGGGIGGIEVAISDPLTITHRSAVRRHGRPWQLLCRAASNRRGRARQLAHPLINTARVANEVHVPHELRQPEVLP